jgi:hypothetical protein
MLPFLKRFYSLAPASLEGFRLMRAHPWSVMLWVATYLVSVVLMGLLIAASIGREGVIGLSVRLTAAAEHPARIPEFILHFGWIPAGLFLLSLLVAMVLVAAMYRAVLAPGEFKVGYARLGADELRLIIVSLLTPILVPGVPMAIAIPLISNIFHGEGISRWFGSVCLIGLAMLTIWVMVRLTLVGPMTLDRGEHSIEDSWRMTRGRFWPLLGLLKVTILIGLVVSLVLPVLAAMLFDYLDSIEPHRHGPSLVRFVTLLAELTVPAILGTLGWIVVAAPAAAVYRDWREQPVKLGTASVS